MWQKMDTLSDGARSRLFARNFHRNTWTLLKTLHRILIMMMLWIARMFQLDILLFGTQRSRMNLNWIKWLLSNGKLFDYDCFCSKARELHKVRKMDAWWRKTLFLAIPIFYPLDHSTDSDEICYLVMVGLDSKFLGLDLVFIRIGLI